MARKTINKITSSRSFLVIISCLASVLLWLYVVNFENTDVETTISGLPVSYLGEADILADRQLIVKNKSGQTVSLTLYGKRNVISSLSRDNISVTVDLRDIKTTGTVDRVYDVSFSGGVKSSDVYILEKSPTYISVSIDKMSSKRVEVRGESNITVADGYMAEPTEYNPDGITVSGPDEIISQIDCAWVVVERENLSKTVTSTMNYKLVDENGKEVVSDEISVDTEQVEVTVPIVMYKDVVLTVDLIEGGGAKREDVVVDIKPDRISLSGDAQTLSAMNQISVGSIDLSSFETSDTQTFTIPISNDINNISGITEAEVTVTVKNLAVKRIIASNIEFINVSDGYTATPVTQYLEVKVRGPQEIVDLINAYNIRIVGDLSDLGQAVGRYAVETKIYIDGYSEAGAVGDYKVVVSIEKDGSE